MKDSGTKWIGEIPFSWEVGRIDNYYSLRNTKVSDADYPPLSVTMKGVLPQLDTAAKTNAHDARKLVKKGDFAINSRSDRRGSCGISAYDGSVSLINTILAPKGKMYPKYFDWLFHTVQFADEFYKWGHGIVDDLWTTNYQDMKKITIPVPSLEEQKSIADFLDYQCSELDSLSYDIQSQINTLEAYKVSVITEAVTMGIDKNIPMKESGIAWCPIIPSHWNIVPSKYYFKNSEERKHSGDIQLTASQKHGIISQKEYMDLEKSKIVLANNGLENWKHIEPLDFVISLRSFQGGLEMSETTGCITWHYVVLKAVKPVFHRYFKWLFKSSAYISALQNTCNYIRDGQDLRYSNFIQVPIFDLPLEEQKQIADYLDAMSADIEGIIAKKQEQLEVLADYKKSLIFEYVTGKKQVNVGNDL